MRSSIKLDVMKALLARTGNKCAMQNCDHPLFNDNNLFVAQLAHIEAVSPKWKRYNPQQTNEERNSYDNLLFLCYRHHKEIDSNEAYTVEVLKKIKTSHELKFNESTFSIPDAILKSTLEEIEHYWDDIEYINKFEHVADDFKIKINPNAQIEELFQCVLENLEEIGSSCDYLSRDTNHKYFDILCLSIPNAITTSYVALKQLEIKVYELALLNDVLNEDIKKKLEELKIDFKETAKSAGIAD